MSASDASVGSADLAPGMTSTLRGTHDPPGYANLSYERDTPQGGRRDEPGTKPPKSDADGKRRRQGRGGAPSAAADPIRDPVMRNVAAQQQQQLRVHIKAQPGTAVHITPSSTPPARPEPPAYHAGYQPAHLQAAGARAYPSGTESETEI